VRVRRAEAALRLRHRPAIDIRPLHGLRLRTPRLELRLPTPGELAALARLAEHGVHDPAAMPFRVAWTDGVGTPSFEADFTAFHLGLRESWRTDDWHLVLGVWADGAPVGSHGLAARGFAAARTVETGSWLGLRHQRRGYGTEMRTAMLALAFDGLGAETATSGVIAGNEASARVSAKLGYEPAGEGVVAPRGEPVRELYFRLTRERWLHLEHAPVEIEGLEPCLPLFGL
jgi:RimJ/RimL family protein N-acetyltransferase